jgi:hypothetical protein
MKHVEFNKAGRWADPDTLVPQIEVEEGEVVEVSDALADLVVANKRGKVVELKEETPKEEKKSKGKKTPATKDKQAAESK